MEGTERKRWAKLPPSHVYRAVAFERTTARAEAIRAMEEAVALGVRNRVQALARARGLNLI
jgi:sugar (pentulose or hexulose) kinase